MFIFNNKTTIPSLDDFRPDYSQLLIRPAIVDISYWRRGFFYNVGNEGVTRNAPELGRKLDYVFGKTTSNKHNIERSLDMERQLNRIGIMRKDVKSYRVILKLLIRIQLMEYSRKMEEC